MRDGLILMADNLTPASDPLTVYKRILEFVYQASVCLFLTDEAGRVTRKNHGEGRIEGLLANLKEGDLPLDIAASTRVFGKEEVDARGGEGRFRRVQVSLLYKAISGTRGYVLVAEEGFSHIHDTILFEMERGSGVAEKLMEIHKGIGKAACDAVDSPSPPSVKDMRDLIVDYTTRYMNLMPVFIRKTFVGAIDSEFHSEV